MWKILEVGNEPENTYIYCDCGIKYRSNSGWIYLESEDVVKNTVNITLQKNKYKCPYCNIVDKISDPTINYTKKQLIKFCNMVGNCSISGNKEKILKNLIERLEID